MSPRGISEYDLYLPKCAKACREILDAFSEMPILQIVVYGSLARGNLGMSSDIDIMLVLDADGHETAGWRKYFNMHTPDYFTDDFPYVDVRFCRKEMYDNPDDSDFGKYIQNCKKDGVCVWPK